VHRELAPNHSTDSLRLCGLSEPIDCKEQLSSVFVDGFAEAQTVMRIAQAQNQQSSNHDFTETQNAYSSCARRSIVISKIENERKPRRSPDSQ
jgi:hypothetical protein